MIHKSIKRKNLVVIKFIFKKNYTMPSRYIDIGANLLDPMFRGIYRGSIKHASDLDTVLHRATLSGLSSIIITASDLIDSRRALHLCRTINSSKQFPNLRLYSTAGVHPLSTRQLDFIKGKDELFSLDESEDFAPFIQPRPINKIEYIDALRDVIRDGTSDHTIVAIGECGLDFEESRLKFASIETQEKHLLFQLELAREFSLPLFLHNRETNGKLLSILKLERSSKESSIRGVVHSFDGSLDEMESFINEGFFIGLNGCSLRTEESLQVSKSIPLDRLLLETDAPWCSIKPSSPAYKYVTTQFESVKKPEKYEQGKCVKDRCEPCEIVKVAEAIAGARGVDVSLIANAAFENTITLFKLEL